MTPAEWFAACSPDPLLIAASDYRCKRPDHERRERLFGCACARQVWHLLPADPRSAVQVSERLAEGHASETDMRAAAVRFPSVAVTATQSAIAAAGWASGVILWHARALESDPMQHSAWEAGRYAARALASECAGPVPPGPSAPEWWHRRWTQAHDAARPVQAAFVRDIFPPPNYTPSLEPAWLTSTVVALARQMDESGEFSITPIFADALQDAGCEDETVLQCCRLPGNVHVRGNWVVDLVLNHLKRV
jgi:hypothetical protein